MDSDRNEALVICISPGINGRWDVSEKGSEAPLESFDVKEDAYAYAIELTKSKQDATVLVEDEEGFSPLPLRREDSSAAEGRSGHGAV